MMEVAGCPTVTSSTYAPGALDSTAVTPAGAALMREREQLASS